LQLVLGIGPTVDREWVRTVATTAERLGFSTIWAPEHVVLLEQYASKYPYLKRYHDAGVEEIALVASGRPRTERDVIAGLEQMAREFVKPAAKL
jgi:alkanesulfonate monooxygenase SsuD/methylene tetrahydromethanopterin reductase-like flavin-dependent oxidoreductase (luciferase family)